MTTGVAQQKCVLHPSRSAAGRCPECEEYYCRECITEHEGRVICASCLEEVTGDEAEEEFDWSLLLEVLKATGGFFLCWFFFYAIAQLLLKISTPLQQNMPF